MIFHPTELEGVRLIEFELKPDERGFFARTYCEKEFVAHGLQTRWPQANTSFTRTRGRLRGLHFQAEPAPETKLVRCIAGTVFDVVVDIRRHAPTFGRWQAFELSAENRRALYIPAGFAHGFQCVSDSCELAYQMSESYVPELARGVRWNDPALAIPWPIPNAELSDRDAALPLLSELP